MNSPPKPVADDAIRTVTEITREIKRLFRNTFAPMWIEGELSGYKRHSSGHHYFTLKDAGAQLSCAMWRGSASRLDFRPEDGQKVHAWGTLEVYEPQGRYQLIVSRMRPAGQGDLQQAFEQLKMRLKKEGLFELERKRLLPEYPEQIGIVTSPTGAAIRDMQSIAARRWPSALLTLKPARVQGSGAAEEIAAAIREFSREGKVDVIVAGRGGGSLEDLWAFNEEIVARAIFESAIPVVSAVGHEVDFTIADLVADVRAPTPSAAMELIVPDRTEVAAEVLHLQSLLHNRVHQQMRHFRSEVDRLASHWALREPINLIRASAQRCDELSTRLITGMRRLLEIRRTRLTQLDQLLRVYHPRQTLRRGYAIARDHRGSVVRRADQVKRGDDLIVTVSQGVISTTITDTAQNKT